MSGQWALARITTAEGPVVVVEGQEGDGGVGALATVDGQTFPDLPELLDAAGGDPRRIEPGERVPTEDATRLCVVGRPRKIVCVGVNYRAHAAETGAQVPDHPMLFPKWDNALAGPFDDIPLPAESTMVDWEAELAFVFGRRCRRVAAERAGDVVFGFTAANDTSMRDWQFHTAQFGPGKSWDRATPLGPVVVPAAGLGGVAPDLSISGRRNGDVMQDSRTTDLIFGVPELVAYLTTFMTMEPGDVVLTGTPSGVGVSRSPAVFLEPGDVYEVEIEGIGTLRNRFVGEP